MKDCPYNCVDGYIMMPALGKKVNCPHCSKIVESIVEGKEKDENGKSIFDILRIPEFYKQIPYNFNTVIPNQDDLEPKSVEDIKSVLDGLLENISIGVKPKYSCLLNLGGKADILLYIFTYLKSAYLRSMSVIPLISITDIQALRNIAEGVEAQFFKDTMSDFNLSYNNLETADVCVVTIDAGASTNSLYILKGLLEGRARRGKSTLVFTNSPLNNLHRSIIQAEQEGVLHLLKFFEVKYKVRQEKSKVEQVLSDSNQTGFDNESSISNSGNIMTMEELSVLTKSRFSSTLE